VEEEERMGRSRISHSIKMVDKWNRSRETFFYTWKHKRPFCPFSLKCLTRYYMIMSFAISSFFWYIWLIKLSWLISGILHSTPLKEISSSKFRDSLITAAINAWHSRFQSFGIWLRVTLRSQSILFSPITSNTPWLNPHIIECNPLSPNFP